MNSKRREIGVEMSSLIVNLQEDGKKFQKGYSQLSLLL